MRNDRDSRDFDDYYQGNANSNREYRNYSYEPDLGAPSYGGNRSRNRGDNTDYERNINFGGYGRDGYGVNNRYRGSRANYDHHEGFRNRDEGRNVDPRYENRRDFDNPDYRRNDGQDRYRSNMERGDWDRDRSIRYLDSRRESRRYDRGPAFEGRQGGYERDYGYREENYYNRHSSHGRQRDYERFPEQRRQEPTSIKDKYSSSSLHYSGITSIGEEHEQDRDRGRYQGSRYVGRNNSDRNYAGSGMGSSYRYRS